MLHRESLIWIIDERIYGELVTMGAYYSTVRYVRDGLEYEVDLENDEFILVEDLIEYDND